MLKKTTSLIKNLSRLIQESDNEMDSLRQVCKELGVFSMAHSVLLVDVEGKILVSEYMEGAEALFSARNRNGHLYLDGQLNEQLKHTVETKLNLGLNHLSPKYLPKSGIKEYMTLIMPVVASMERLATLLVCKASEFTEEDQTASELCVIVSALTIRQSKFAKNEEETNRMNIVKSAIDALSYSELEAVLHIFSALNGNDGLVIASKVADEFKLTRSVIVNGLRKLESAGIIESRSLGMKGTHIKIKNPLFIGELNKLKV